MLSRNVTQFPVHCSLPQSPGDSKNTVDHQSVVVATYCLFLLSSDATVETHTHTHTCIVGLQDALEGLSIVIASQSQLFVDVVCRQLHFGIVVVVGRLLTDLIMERLERYVLQNAHLT